MIIYAKSNDGVEWESFDGQPAKHIFMICAPDGGADEHLKALASLSQALMDSEVKAGLEAARAHEPQPLPGRGHRVPLHPPPRLARGLRRGQDPGVLLPH